MASEIIEDHGDHYADYTGLSAAVAEANRTGKTIYARIERRLRPGYFYYEVQPDAVITIRRPIAENESGYVRIKL